MSFGLTGASGSGKSTLAKKLADEMGITYLDASTTKIMSEIDFNPVGPTAPIDERIEAQEYLLKRFREVVRQTPRPFVSDRTPLDMAGYMLGEITMRNCTAEQGARAYKYARDCQAAAMEDFEAILVVRPLPFYPVASTRPPPNIAYQWEFTYLMEGMISAVKDDPGAALAILTPTALEKRIAAAKGFFSDQIKEIMELRDEVGAH